MRASLLALLVLLTTPLVEAQTPAPPPEAAGPVVRGPRRLSGPRIGATLLSPKLVDKINETFGRTTCSNVPPYSCTQDEVIGSLPLISQFGWQWERRLFQLTDGTTGVTEIVALVGGAEYGVLLPSATFLVGMRTPSGLEFGLGPNVSGTSVGYALTVGRTQDLGQLAFPVNVAVVLGPDGPRASVLVGVVIADRYY